MTGWLIGQDDDDDVIRCIYWYACLCMISVSAQQASQISTQHSLTLCGQTQSIITGALLCPSNTFVGGNKGGWEPQSLFAQATIIITIHKHIHMHI
ncbi:hypothetical protein BLOT_014777 [Blomia tropicalis]|nr:hypothetical protein BLOT_014777 [Blomia tropicalis]